MMLFATLSDAALVLGVLGVFGAGLLFYAGPLQLP